MEVTSPLRQRIARAVYRVARGAVHAGLGSRPAISVARLCGVRRASVFMFHRFSDGEVHGATDPNALRAMLAALRKQGVACLRLSELLEYVAQRRELPGPTAVFTVDDGYADFDHLAAPIFEGFDVRPTVFTVSEFISGRLWCWWDFVEESFRQSERREVVLHVGGEGMRYSLATPDESLASARSFTEVLKSVPDCERLRAIAALGAALEVELPQTPPPKFAAMTWDDMRRLESAGVDFGPHTMTHPILSRVPMAKLYAEVAGSWRALRKELADPMPIFCYPNGTPDSFGQREIDMVRSAGMLGAVAFRRQYVDPSECSAADRFSLSRFPAPFDATAASYVASGLAWD